MKYVKLENGRVIRHNTDTNLLIAGVPAEWTEVSEMEILQNFLSFEGFDN